MTAMLAWVFWNSHERRLRAGWRIATQLVVLLVALTAWSAVRRALGDDLPFTLADRGFNWLLLLTSLAAITWLDRRTRVDAGIIWTRPMLRESLVGVAIGGALMSIIVVGGLTSGALQWSAAAERSASSAAAIVMLGAVTALLVAVSEEIWFRGFLQRNVAEGLRGALGTFGAKVASVFAVALFFAALHLLQPMADALAALNIALAGLLLGWLYVATNRLALPIGLHLAWNFVMGPICGSAVSGHATESSLWRLEFVGPAAWTGGAYGLEGGLLATTALVGGIAMTGLFVGLSTALPQDRPVRT